ncbi:MAG: RagB/SusD family nutrient uptake outer membrane protein, partial [Sphingobacteriales bacterium]
MKQSLLILLVILCASISNAQVGIGTSTPNVNAMLDVTSTSKGFLPPRMSTSQRMAMVNPQSGMIVFDDTERALYVYIFFRGWQKVLTGFSGTYSLPTDVSSIAGAAAEEVTAKNVLFTLAKNRDANYVLSTNTGAAFLNEILIQRRVELWGEGFRFFDLKRMNAPLDRTGGNATVALSG